jgi:hypothetical protein
MGTEKKLKGYKVYGGDSFILGKQVRMIVAARSRKRVSELTGLSIYDLTNYWSITRNEDELETALNEPETVFYREFATWKEKYDWNK